MARGGLSFNGIGGIERVTYEAGEDLKALVVANGRDSVVGLPVVVTLDETVDLGAGGDVIDGIIEVYENDGHVGVIIKGFVEDVPIVKSSTTLKGVVTTNGSGKARDLAPITIGTETLDLNGIIKAPTFHKVDADAETATVFLG